MLGHLVNETSYKSLMKELTEFKEKCRVLTVELDTKNI